MPNPVLREGSRGTAVLKLTRILKRRGHLESTRHSFNRAVRRAVEEFQARHVDELGRPLVADGVVGPLTWWALENEIEVLAPPVGVDFASMPARGGSPRGRAALKTGIDEMKAGSREIGGNNSGRFIKKYLGGILDPPANWLSLVIIHQPVESTTCIRLSSGSKKAKLRTHAPCCHFPRLSRRSCVACDMSAASRPRDRKPRSAATSHGAQEAAAARP